MFGRGQLYFSIMKPFALLLNLVLGILQAGLNALSLPFLNYQLRRKLLVLLLSGIQGLVGLEAKVGLDPSLISGVPHPFLDYKHLLDGLHRNDRRVCY